MKNVTIILSILIAAGSCNLASGQFLEKQLKKAASKKINSIFEEKKENEEPAKEVKPSGTEKDDAVKETQIEEPKLVWAKYDFVPGEILIFEDNLEGEENGEFPSRWDLHQGNTEIAKVDGENVILFRDGHPSVVPYFRSAASDYLPDVFTIEFDLYCGPNDFVVYLYDRKNQKTNSPTGYTYFNIRYNKMEFGNATSTLPDEDLQKRRWIHVAIAYTNGKLKGYIDETRLINIPRIDFEPSGLTLYTYHARNDNPYYVKNIRIARGGVKYYDRVMQDGKIIANGIRFETGKATIRPESMGIINDIVALMNEHPELRFSVEGHTDNVGDDSSNNSLSEHRAAAVKSLMIEMGVDASRLASKGWGESKPVSGNDTPEGRANNRRVEFVKLDQ